MLERARYSAQMLEIIEQAVARCAQPRPLAIWNRLTALGGSQLPPLASLIEPLDDGEQLVLLTALTLVRPELGPDAARAWLSRKSRDSRIERRLYLRGVADQVVRAMASGLSVQELIEWAGTDTALLLPAVQERASRSEINEATALTQAISPWAKDERGLAWAAIAEALARSGQDPTACAERAIVESSSRPYIAQPGGGEEVRALAGVLRVLVTFLAPDHPSILRAVRRLEDSLEEWCKGLDYELSRAAEVFADAARTDPRWLEHAHTVFKVLGGDRQAHARIVAAEIALGRRPASDAVQLPEERPFVPDTLDQIAARDSLWYRAGDALERAQAALEKGDTELAERAIAVALSPPVRPLSAEQQARWLSARIDTSDPQAASALAEALAKGSGDAPSPLLELLPQLPPEGVRVVMEALIKRGRLLALCSHDRQRVVLDALIPVVPPEDRQRLAEVVRALEVGSSWYDRTREERRLAALRSLDPSGAEPDAAEQAAMLAARGRWEEAMALVDPQTRTWLVQARGGAIGASPPEVDLAASALNGDDLETWRHRIALAHLSLGQEDEALQLCQAMGDCRVSGFGPAPLAAEIAASLQQSGGWSARRAAQLVSILGGWAVHPQDLPESLLEVVPLAWPHLLGTASLEPLREKLAPYPADAATVDLALARAQTSPEALASFDRALAAASGERFLFVGPGVFLATLRLHPEWPDWERRWQESVALYRSFAPADAARAMRHHAMLSLPRERALWLQQVGPDWAHEVREALFDIGCALLARAPLDEALLAHLCAQASDANTVRQVMAAAAPAALRAGRSETAVLARRAGLET